MTSAIDPPAFDPALLGLDCPAVPSSSLPMSELQSGLDGLRARLLQRIEEANDRFAEANRIVAQAGERMRTIDELHAEAEQSLANARAEAAAIREQACAERDLSVANADHHVQTGRAMAELETSELLARTVARAREADRIVSDSLARMQTEMEMFVQNEVLEHEREIARLHDRHNAMRDQMGEILRLEEPAPNAGPEIDLRGEVTSESAPEIFDAIDDWIANRFS